MALKQISMNFKFIRIAAIYGLSTVSLVAILIGVISPANAETIKDRFSPPKGYERIKTDGFGTYLRALPLMPLGTDVKYYDGSKVWHHNAAAVVKMDIGDVDLQQCADTAIRLFADFKRFENKHKALSFKFTSGDAYSYADYLNGKRPVIKGKQLSWKTTPKKPDSEAAYRSWLRYIYMYAGTASLGRDLKPIPNHSARIGDLYINPGYPGHAAMIADMAVHPKTGDVVIMLVQGFLPAQSVHIVGGPIATAWFPINQPINSLRFTFTQEQLYRF